MKKIFSIFVLALLVNNTMIGQEQEVGYDSIYVKSYDGQKIKYVLDDPLLKKLSISKSHPKHAQLKGKHFFGDAGRGMLTLISGVGTGDSKENIDLKFINRIRCKERKFDWDINIYCKGSMDNELSRNENEDGGFSLSIDHYAHINWDQGVSGEIMKGEHKIGEFILIKNLNSAISFTGPLVFLNELNLKYAKDNDSSDKKMEEIHLNDYAIIGELYGQKFSVINDFEKKRCSIYQDNTIKTILQTSAHDNSASGKKYFLLKNPEVSEWESTYWSKLALFFEYLNQTVKVSSYQW